MASKNTDGLDKSSRDFLESAIEDYNAMFKTNYDTSADRFQNYYKDGVFFLFLRVLRCFSSPGSLPYVMDWRMDA